MAAKNQVGIIITAKDMASRVVRGVGKAFTTLKSRVASVKNSVFSLQGALVALGAGAAGKGFLDTANDFELMADRLDKGTISLQELNAWALKMPVNTQKAVDSFIMMQAMGLDPTISKMTTLVDVSSKLGEDTMPRIARALGQMTTLGKLSAEELNQLAEAGINARKYLRDAFGKSVEEIQNSAISIEEVVDAILKGLDRDFGGSAAKAQNAFRGLKSTAVSFWTEFKRMTMDAGLFEYIKAGLSLVLEKVGELHKSGKLAEWAQKTSDSVIRFFKSTALGAARLVDTVGPVLDSLTKKASSMWETYKSLPSWVRNVGLVGVLLGGKKGMLVATGLLHLVDRFSDTADGLKYVADGRMDFWGEFIGDVEKFRKQLEKFRAEDEFGRPKNVFRGLVEGSGVAGTESAVSYVESLFKELDARVDSEQKKRAGQSKKGNSAPKPKESAPALVGALQPDVAAKAELEKLTADQSLALADLESQYERHTIKISEFFARRRMMVESLAAVETRAAAESGRLQIEKLTEQANAEKSRTKRQEILNQIKEVEANTAASIYTIDKKRLETLARITDEERKANEQLAEQKRRKQSILLDADSVLAGNDSAAQLDNEHARIKASYDEKIRLLRDYSATEEEIKRVQAAKEREISEATRKHHEEQERAKLAVFSNVVGGMGDLMKDLNQMGLQNSKEGLAVYKAFATAEAIISTYSAATAAYKQGVEAGGPFGGPALGTAYAALAVAQGLAKVAIINSAKAEGYAHGGLIAGPDQGPRADNVTIRATPGEYMMDRPTVGYYGRGVMQAIHQRKIPRELLGGFAIPTVPSMGARTGFATGGMVSSRDGYGSSSEELTIVNVSDQSQLERFLASSAGSRILLNVMRSNGPEIRKIAKGQI